MSESISSGFNGEEGGKILLVSSAKSGNATKEFMSLLSDKLKESGIETGNTEVDYSEGISVSERFLSETSVFHNVFSSIEFICFTKSSFDE